MIYNKYSVFNIAIFLGICQAEIPAGVPDLDDFEAIKERCDKKGGSGTYDKVKVPIRITKQILYFFDVSLNLVYQIEKQYILQHFPPYIVIASNLL